MTWEYISGFFDGEGCIYVYNAGLGERVRLQISQKRTEVLSIIKKFLFDRNIHGIIVYPDIKVASIRINRNGDVLNFLNNVVDHLVVKKDEAIYAIELLKKLNLRKRFTVNEMRQMKKLWDGGCSSREISKIMKRPQSSIKSYCYKGQGYSTRFIDDPRWLE